MSHQDPTQVPLIQESIARLRPILSPIKWNKARGNALVNFLDQYEITFSDGFVLNGDEDESILGFAQAAMIVAALCDNPRHDWPWWKALAPTGDLSMAEMMGLFDEFAQLFAAHPTVATVSL